MKKFLYSFLAVGALAGLASCASDEPMVRDNDGRVSFAINLPTMGTRAFGDTPECDQLTYTVYDEDGNVVIEDTTVPAFGPGVTQDNVTLQLVKNQSYRIVFYANNSKSTFAEYKAGSITVNYENLQVNNEQDDAFFRSYPFTVDGTEQVVKLYRPFAQVNIGTDDLDAPAVKHIISNLKTTLTVTQGLYGEMNLKDSTLVETSAVTDPTVFSVTGAAENTDFPVSGYSNLLSVYMLVPTGQNMIDATCVMDNNGKEINTLNLASTPVQLNYRTNIYGTLLTTQQPFNVIIEPAFNQPDYKVIVDSPEALATALLDPTINMVEIPENSTIDLSKTYGSSNPLRVTTAKTINNNGTIVTAPFGLVSRPGGTLTFEGNGELTGEYGLITSESGDIVVNGGKFVTTGYDVLKRSSIIYCGQWQDSADNWKIHQYEGNVTINGGTFESSGYAVVNSFYAESLEINGGTFVAKCEAGGSNSANYVIFSNNTPTTNVSNATLVGEWGGLRVGGSSSKPCTVNVENTTIIVTNAFNNNAQHCIVADVDYGQGGTTVNVKSGNFYTGGPNGLMVVMAGNPKGTANITGGFFGKSVTPAAGYKVNQVTKSIEVLGNTYELKYEVVKE